MSRPLFKNKAKKDNNAKHNDDYDLYEDEIDFDSLMTTPKVVYNEEEDGDLSILDQIIGRGKSSKERAKEEKKKRKKEEKKEKKKKDKEKKKYKKKEKGMIDLDDLYEDMTVRRRKAEKNNEDFYTTRFGGSMVLLRELMKQVNGQLVNNISIQDELKGMRVRGGLNALTTQSANINSLLSTKLNVVKEINSINKTVSDLELKRLKDQGGAAGAEGAMSEDYLMNEIYSKVINSKDTDRVKGGSSDDKKSKKKGKKSKKKSNDIDIDEIDDDHLYTSIMDERINGDETDYIDDAYEDIEEDEAIKYMEQEEEKESKRFNSDEYDDPDEALEARLEALMEEGEIEFSDTERAFEHEGSVELIVIKNPDNERWRFAAINPDGDELYDYPLPDKKAVGRMTFDRQTGTAKDKLNNVYKLEYEIPSRLENLR